MLLSGKPGHRTTVRVLRSPWEDLPAYLRREPPLNTPKSRQIAADLHERARDEAWRIAGGWNGARAQTLNLLTRAILASWVASA